MLCDARSAVGEEEAARRAEQRLGICGGGHGRGDAQEPIGEETRVWEPWIRLQHCRNTHHDGAGKKRLQRRCYRKTYSLCVAGPERDRRRLDPLSVRDVGSKISNTEKWTAQIDAVSPPSDGQESPSSEEAPWGLKVYLFRLNCSYLINNKMAENRWILEIA